MHLVPSEVAAAVEHRDRCESGGLHMIGTNGHAQRGRARSVMGKGISSSAGEVAPVSPLGIDATINRTGVESAHLAGDAARSFLRSVPREM